jgi:hypothetical protein
MAGESRLIKFEVGVDLTADSICKKSGCDSKEENRRQ